MTFRRDIFRRLLGYGFFPRELPPTFSTRLYGVRLARRWSEAPSALSLDGLAAEPARHSLARSGPLRRQLSIPNPVTFPALAFEIAGAWQEIDQTIHQSQLTQSRPLFHRRGGRCFLPQFPKQGLLETKVATRVGARALLVADIARFYPSVYTHSVPWALHGKTEAKKRRRDMKLLGNRLDKALRNCSGGQTVGIPIGPDTSLVIAEIILSQVDKALASSGAFAPHSSFRHMDEYEVAAPNQAHAESAVAVLQEQLADYELELNPRKTRIDLLPARHDSAWVSRIRSQRIRGTDAGQASDLISIFDLAFEQAHREPESPVLRYLAGRLKGEQVRLANWRLFQHLLLQLITVEPATIAAAMALVIAHQAQKFAIDRNSFEEALNRVIEHHGQLGHGNEVAWALWSILTFKLRVHRGAIGVLEQMMDAGVVLSAMHAEEEGLLDGNLDKTRWSTLVDRGSLLDENWLLVYEGVKQNWLPGGAAVIRKEPGFRFLWDLDVSFYVKRAVSAHPSGVPPSLGFAPAFYV